MESLLGILLAGIVGGNLAAMGLPNINLGVVRNSVFGMVGSLIGVKALSFSEIASGLAAELVAGTLAGGILTALIGALINLADRR